MIREPPAATSVLAVWLRNMIGVGTVPRAKSDDVVDDGDGVDPRRLAAFRQMSLHIPRGDGSARATPSCRDIAYASRTRSCRRATAPAALLGRSGAITSNRRRGKRVEAHLRELQPRVVVFPEIPGTKIGEQRHQLQRGHGGIRAHVGTHLQELLADVHELLPACHTL